MLKFRSTLEFFDVLTNLHKWQWATVAGSIGLVGCLVNVALFSAGRMPPRIVWNLFPVVTFTAASIEIIQAIGVKKDA